MSSHGELTWWGAGTVPPPASIVWCNFPTHLAPGVPGPKSRPGLVFKVRYADDPPGERFLVQVAYGTTKLKTASRPDDFIIANSVMLDILRLPSATRFDLDTIAWLPWAKEYFAPREESDPFCTPVVSTLPADMQRLLGWTMQIREEDGLNAAYHTPPPAAAGLEKD